MNFKFLLATLLVTTAYAAEPPTLRITLKEAEALAVQNSDALAAAELDHSAATDRASSQFGLLWPKLSIDASYRYVTEVPSLSLPVPGATRTIPFGDNKTYSIGPVLSWNIWDSGATYYGWKAQQSISQSRGEEFKARKRQTRLSIRLAYFNVQLALERVRLLSDSLKLAEAQYRDIQTRLQVGASNRIDAYSSHRQVLDFKLQLLQARSSLAAELRNLLTLTKQTGEWDTSMPLHEHREPLSADIDPASVIISLDPIERSRQELKEPQNQNFSAKQHPQARALSLMSEASWRSAKSSSAGNWPKIQLSAKTSLDYPNGPVLERIRQNTVALTASWSLFEGGRVMNDASEKRMQAEAAERRQQQVENDLERDWKKGLDQLKGLRAQQNVNQQAVTETEELARLIYESYKAGRSNILDVQNANFRAVEAKIQAVRNDVQILIQMAILANLADGENHE